MNICSWTNKCKMSKLFAAFFLLAAIASASQAQQRKSRPDKVKITHPAAPILWSASPDIRSLDLFYGPGGKAHLPHGTYTFIDEDISGSNPKFDVRDENGQKWKIKLGKEARSETAASRLVWAIGYFTDEDYFVPELHVKSMPLKVKRGKEFIDPGGILHGVRLERRGKWEKIGRWKWRENPFSGTRDLNGLRVMMALINNWDLKDENNTIYRVDDGREVYLVGDLGASFGAPGLIRPTRKSRDDLASYSESKFVTKITQDYVDFQTPARPALVYLVSLPHFIMRLQIRWIGRHVPRSDVKWTAALLGRLTRSQIDQAFRASGYSAEEARQFTTIIEERIQELEEL